MPRLKHNMNHRFEFPEDHYDVEPDPWTDADEAALEEWEEKRRAKLAESLEY